jgi:hypothetical protein
MGLALPPSWTDVVLDEDREHKLYTAIGLLVHHAVRDPASHAPVPALASATTSAQALDAPPPPLSQTLRRRVSLLAASAAPCGSGVCLGLTPSAASPASQFASTVAELQGEDQIRLLSWVTRLWAEEAAAMAAHVLSREVPAYFCLRGADWWHELVSLSGAEVRAAAGLAGR